MNFACVKVLLTHLKVAYTNPYVLKWSVWVAFATCGYFQVGNYIQALWKYIETEDNPENYNGAVEATATLIGIYRNCTIVTRGSYLLTPLPPPSYSPLYNYTNIYTVVLQVCHCLLLGYIT